MNIALLTLSFGAGVAIFFSPCGIALLPSYIALLISKKEDDNLSKFQKGVEGLKIGAIVSLGIITVFIGFGVIVSLAGNILAPYAVWLGSITGLLLIVLGIFMLTGKKLSIPQLYIKTDMITSFRVYYLFGIGYALGSIACTLGIFLFVISTALISGSITNSFFTFISFAAGTVLLMLVVTTSAAVAKAYVSKLINKYVRHVQIASALIIIAGGGYIIWFNLNAFIF